MARGTNLYRRGAVYWWRRRLTLAVLEKSPITLSLSLLTKELSIARARGAAMTMVSERLRMTIHEQLSSGKIAPAQAKSIYQDAVREMGSALLEMTGGLTLESSPELPTSDRALVIVKEFWHSVAAEGIRAAPGWSYADRNWPALDEDEKSQLMFTARAICAKQKFEAQVIEALLAAGCEPTTRNQATAAKLIAEARAEAASRALQPGWINEWMLSGEDSRPVTTTAGLSKDAPQADGCQAVGMDPTVDESFFAAPCGPRLVNTYFSRKSSRAEASERSATFSTSCGGSDVTPVFHPAAARDRPVLSRMSAGKATGGFKPTRCRSSLAAKAAGVA